MPNHKSGWRYCYKSLGNMDFNCANEHRLKLATCVCNLNLDWSISIQFYPINNLNNLNT